jgi:phosphate transport system substrate-binding protein
MKKVLFLFLSLGFSYSQLNWVGCGITRKAYMAELSKAYTSKTSIPITIEKGGSATKGIREISANRADIGGTCRLRLKVGNKVAPEEKDARLIQVGWDALAIITNKKNPVKSLTFYQIRDIFDGKLTKWEEIPESNLKGKINVYARKGKISGVGLMSRLIIFNDVNADFKSTKEFPASGPLERAILKDKYAIGISGISSAKKRDLNIISVGGYYPNKENIMSSKYKLFRPIFLSIHANAPKKVQDFIRFARSKEGQKVISKAGTVNLFEGRMLNNIWKRKMKTYVKYVEPALKQ